MVIGFYSHPEYYPPTLNALSYLSDRYDNIYIVHRNYPSFNWQFPENIKLVSNGATTPIRQVESASLFIKLKLFFRFTWLLFRYIRKQKPDTVLLYDSIPVLAYWLIRPFVRRPRVLWYHNHDVSDPGALSKYSIGWWSVKAEKWLFPSVDIFTLPAEERKKYFPMDDLKGKFFFLPNFPSKRLYKKHFTNPKTAGRQINFTYQGFLGPGHGLEEIIKFILPGNGENEFRLYLKGMIDKEYQKALLQISEQHGVERKLIIEGFIPYSDLPASNLNNHIGIAIYKDTDIMNSTISTASNKIYEYAASGMPVLVYDNSYFRELLHQYEWIVFTDTSGESLQAGIKKITSNYEQLSAAALGDFNRKLNFEHRFKPFLREL